MNESVARYKLFGVVSGMMSELIDRIAADKLAGTDYSRNVDWLEVEFIKALDDYDRDRFIELKEGK